MLSTVNLVCLACLAAYVALPALALAFGTAVSRRLATPQPRRSPTWTSARSLAAALRWRGVLADIVAREAIDADAAELLADVAWSEAVDAWELAYDAPSDTELCLPASTARHLRAHRRAEYRAADVASVTPDVDALAATMRPPPPPRARTMPSPPRNAPFWRTPTVAATAWRRPVHRGAMGRWCLAPM